MSWIPATGRSIPMAALCRRIRIHRGTATRAANGKAIRLVVHTSGFRDGMWLDATGNPMTDAAKITERFRRIDFGQHGNRDHSGRSEGLHEAVDSEARLR